MSDPGASPSEAPDKGDSGGSSETPVHDDAVRAALELLLRAVVDLPTTLVLTLTSTLASSGGSATAGAGSVPPPLPASEAGAASPPPLLPTSGAGAASPPPLPPTSSVSAFDRPNPVIVVGPVPLPVSGGGGGGSKPAAEGPGLLDSLGSKLAGKFAAVIGPLAIFGQILQSNAAGFQILGTAVQILAAALAPILLPIVLAIAAAMIELSDELSAALGPAIKSFTRFILGTVLPVLSFLAKVIGTVAEGLGFLADALFATAAGAAKGVVEAVKDPVGTAKGELGKVDEAVDELTKLVIDAFKRSGKTFEDFAAAAGFSGEEKDRFKRMVDADAGRATPDAAPAAAPPKKREAIDDVITSLRMSMMPKSSTTGLGSVYGQVQTGALNADPLQQRLLLAMMRAADGIDGVRADMREARPAPPPVFPVDRR